MTSAWSPWLPEDAVVPGAAQQALADLAKAWSHEWFAGDPACRVGQLTRIAVPRSELLKAVWHRCEAGVAIGLPRAGAAALGALVLDVATIGNARNEKDLGLLESLGKECLDGFKLRLGQLLGLAKAAWYPSDTGCGDTVVYRTEISLAARAVTVQLDMTTACFARFALSMLPSPAGAAALGSGLDALSRIPVPLSALLGRCSLSLAELSGLAAGDVLVLETRTEDSLPLVVGRAPLARGGCTVIESGAGLALKIVQAPTG